VAASEGLTPPKWVRFKREQTLRDIPCSHCHETGRLKGTASRGAITKYFCHEGDKSCYNERKGAYFDD
jgi:hypothetical protein